MGTFGSVPRTARTIASAVDVFKYAAKCIISRCSSSDTDILIWCVRRGRSPHRRRLLSRPAAAAVSLLNAIFLISFIACDIIHLKVASYMSAWIEIINQYLYVTVPYNARNCQRSKSLFLRGCGLFFRPKSSRAIIASSSALRLSINDGLSLSI